MSAPTEDDLHADRLRVGEDLRAMSDGELIGNIERRGTANYSGHQFELQRRFTEQITGAIQSGRTAAWGLFGATVALVIVTALLAIATFRLV